jgi:hypothetical protein
MALGEILHSLQETVIQPLYFKDTSLKIGECTKFRAGLPWATYPLFQGKIVGLFQYLAASGSLAPRPLVINFENKLDAKSKLELEPQELELTKPKPGTGLHLA